MNKNSVHWTKRDRALRVQWMCSACKTATRKTYGKPPPGSARRGDICSESFLSKGRKKLSSVSFSRANTLRY
jgi:hypothetical protein